MQTPDQGIYVTDRLDYALEYAGLEYILDRVNEKWLLVERPGFEGKDHYVFILQIDTDELMIDEDYLGTLAFALQRILPLLQQIYASISVIRSYKFSLIKVLNLIKQ